MSEREPGDIRTVLSYYGANVPPHDGGWRSIRCPFHSDGNASAGYSTDAGAFNCLGCGIRGNCISLIMEVEKIDFTAALRKYEEIVGGEHPGLSKSVREQSRGFDILGRRKGFEQGSGFSPKDWLRRGAPDGR